MPMDVAYRLQNQGLDTDRAAGAFYSAVKAIMWLRNTGVLLAVFCLGACNTVGERTQSFVPALTFAHYKTLPLDVGKIDIRSPYNADSRADNVDNLFPLRPENALTRYLQQRYRSSKNNRTKLEAVVRDAHATRERVNKNNGVMTGLVSKGRERYTVFIELALAHRGEENQLIRRVVLNFRKGFVVPVRLSLAERERHMNGFIQRFIQDIDKTVQNAMLENLHILPANIYSVTSGQHASGLMPGMPLESAGSRAPEMGAEQDQYRQ